MTAAKDPTVALVAVVKALSPLEASDRQWVLQSAANKWSMNVDLNAPGGVGGSGGAGTGTGAGTKGTFATAKEFIKAKSPKGEKQLVACLAWWLEHQMSTSTFKAADIAKVNRDEAKGQSFNAPRALGDAARTKFGYLASVGGGKKQLSAFGEDVVNALPDQATVSALESNRKSSVRRHKKKSKK
jgi:hypothetical protein